jgi:hypothetical protein
VLVLLPRHLLVPLLSLGDELFERRAFLVRLFRDFIEFGELREGRFEVISEEPLAEFEVRSSREVREREVGLSDDPERGSLIGNSVQFDDEGPVLRKQECALTVLLSDA